MEALSPPRGLIVELVTPFKRDGGIDGRGLGRLLDRVSPYAQGVFLASPRAGEGKALTPDLRVELLEQAILSIRRNPVPIFMWVTGESEDKTRETILALKEAAKRQKHGADLFWVDTPLYYHSNRGLPHLYEDLCAIGGAPFILHNDPELIGSLAKSFKRNNIRTAVLKELTALKEITGLIFSGSLDRAHHYQRACRGRPHFRIYDGDEAHFLDHPSRSGAVSIGANLAPGAWEKITQSSLHLSSNGKEYPDRLQQIWESGDSLRSMREIYLKASVAIIKDILAEMGIIKTPVSITPAEDIEESRTRLMELITRLGDCRL